MELFTVGATHDMKLKAATLTHDILLPDKLASKTDFSKRGIL